jgi:hypothetical protein
VEWQRDNINVAYWNSESNVTVLKLRVLEERKVFNDEKE